MPELTRTANLCCGHLACQREVEALLEAQAERVRAALRLISPDHITPLGKRQIERVLAEGQG